MIEGLRPYPAYVDSSVAWVGKVPAGWQVMPVHRMGRVQGGKALAAKAPGVERPYLRVANVLDGVIDARSVHTMPFTNAEFETFRLREGDVLLNEGQSLELVGRTARYRGLPEGCAFQNSLIRVQAYGNTSPRFLERLFRHAQASGIFSTIATQTTSIAHLGVSRLADLMLAVPPRVDQDAIVRFLGHMEQRTQAYVAKRRRLITLLEEEKRALIERAVTRGLDPNVRLKDAGVAWLGAVAEGWEVAALHFRYDQCLGKMVDAKAATGQHPVPYLRNVDVRWDHINIEALPLIDIRPDEYERFTVRKGDLLVCEGRHLGRCAFWDGRIEPCAFQKALHRLRVRDSARDVPRFLFYLMRVAHERAAFDMGRLDNTIPHLTGEMLRAHRFPFPPVEEQRQIVEFLDTRSAEVDAVVRRIRSELDLLQEYRRRLIADVVTGKVDVREAAASLPELDAEPVDTIVDAPEEDEEEELAKEEP